MSSARLSPPIDVGADDRVQCGQPLRLTFLTVRSLAAFSRETGWDRYHELKVGNP
jgi:hypothetical protein